MKDTIRVRRANVTLDISSDQKNYYLGKGYSVIDDNGKILEETTVPTIESLTNRIAKLQEELKKKDAEIEKLKASKPGRKSERND